MSSITAIFIGIGVFFNLLGCLGLLRMPDVYNRLQTATKCVTLGTWSILFAVFLHFGFSATGIKALIGIPLLIVPIAGPFLFFMAPVYGALIGYNKNSRDSKTAFINIEDGQLCFGSLAVSFRLNPYDKKDIIKSVDLVAVRF